MNYVVPTTWLTLIDTHVHLSDMLRTFCSGSFSWEFIFAVVSKSVDIVKISTH